MGRHCLSHCPDARPTSPNVLVAAFQPHVLVCHAAHYEFETPDSNVLVSWVRTAWSPSSGRETRDGAATAKRFTVVI